VSTALDLHRFVEAPAGVVAQALAELLPGAKRRGEPDPRTPELLA
jgi:uncharacterized protein (DUF1810 family)